MSVPHPWQALSSRPHLTVDFVHLPRPYLGVTDGLTIWLHDRLTQRERRTTLAHELVHIDRGHTSCQPSDVEASVWREAARWLLPDIETVGEALAWAHSLDEAADELWVDCRTLQARLDHLHPAERAYLRRRLTDEPHITEGES
ncbi:ImmA/IrrE family metallo-endopeptidase [Aestuariimicrobium soli]|uniref:ImmA/IrrE family metallo-endopeptidase n=1 Tax=Aestuariimicrobium soli TaxID=2035834 RepID=UPI003EBD3E08